MALTPILASQPKNPKCLPICWQNLLLLIANRCFCLLAKPPILIITLLCMVLLRVGLEKLIESLIYIGKSECSFHFNDLLIGDIKMLNTKLDTETLLHFMGFIILRTPYFCTFVQK